MRLMWSNTWESWRDRLLGAAFLMIALALLYASARWLAFWQVAVVWAVYVLILAFVSRQGWFKLFGPVLFYDMVRTARRSRYSIIRIIYGSFLFVTLCYMVLMLALQPHLNGRPMLGREQAVVAEVFFAFFMIVQVIVVVMLTPAYVAGAIADEKDRKTLEFLLATDLENREIIFSKLLSRLGNLTLLLLTGLPILSILQLMGGVDPELMLSGFAGIGLTMLGIASVSIFFSTLLKKPRDAISMTYLFLLAYGTTASLGLAFSSSPLLQTPIWFGDDPPTLRDVVFVANTGNPINAIAEVVTAMNNGVNRAGVRSNLAAELPGILSRYAWFHLGLCAGCITWSILRVRAIALKQSPAGTTQSARFLDQLRPGVGPFPMLWKECFIEGRTKFTWYSLVAGLIILGLTLGIGGWIIFDAVDRDRLFTRRFCEDMNWWFRIAGTAGGCLMLLMLSVRAATSITSEREKDTFDALITSPMSADGMLLAKVFGNLTSMRPAWFWFAAMLLMALCSAGLHPLAVPIILVAWFIYAIFATMLGLLFSMSCQSSIWSSLFTVLTMLFLGGGHWLITSCFCMPVFGLMMMAARNARMERVVGEAGKYWSMFQGGLTPPAVLGFCSFGWDERMFREREAWEFFGFCMLGLVLWIFMSGILWFGLLAPKFRHLARRIELEYD
ncbi:MAG TPA: ABC transporter permease subunit [Gemmataceae bacterium]|nr:ABC transporter permease subunit [Gemmataceae bacterium]